MSDAGLLVSAALVADLPQSLLLHQLAHHRALWQTQLGNQLIALCNIQMEKWVNKESIVFPQKRTLTFIRGLSNHTLSRPKAAMLASRRRYLFTICTCSGLHVHTNNATKAESQLKKCTIAIHALR